MYRYRCRIEGCNTTQYKTTLFVLGYESLFGAASFAVTGENSETEGKHVPADEIETIMCGTDT